MAPRSKPPLMESSRIPDGKTYMATLKLSHGNGYETCYGHNSRLLVNVGQTVRKGQKIALAGATGEATGPHCHYEVRDHGSPINPVPFLQIQ